jgi:hypothetical protein
MKWTIYVAGADKGKSYPEEMAERLEKALSEAGVDHRCEIYPGGRFTDGDGGFPCLQRGCGRAALGRTIGALCREAWIELLFSPFTPQHLPPTLSRYTFASECGTWRHVIFFGFCRLQDRISRIIAGDVVAIDDDITDVDADAQRNGG